MSYVNRLAGVIVHALAIFGLIALAQHFTPKVKYSDEALLDDTGVVLEKHVTHKL